MEKTDRHLGGKPAGKSDRRTARQTDKQVGPSTVANQRDSEVRQGEASQAAEEFSLSVTSVIAVATEFSLLQNFSLPTLRQHIAIIISAPRVQRHTRTHYSSAMLKTALHILRRWLPGTISGYYRLQCSLQQTIQHALWFLDGYWC